MGQTSSANPAREEERIRRKKAAELFENGVPDTLPAGKFLTLQAIHQYLFENIYEREVYLNGIDHSCYDEGYTTFKAKDL